MSTMKHLLGFVIVATMASSAFASFCYNCDSAKNSKCGENFVAEDILITNCSSNIMRALLKGQNANVNGCLKLTRKDELGGQTILRTCDLGEISLTGDSCKHDPTKDVSCYICTDDLCNVSARLAPLTVVIVAFMGLARIFS